MKCYLETISLLQREPDRWLAQKSVLHIMAFLGGFGCSDVLGTALAPLTPLENAFGEFLFKKHGGHDGNYWFELCKEGYDDAGSFELYFKDWREFYRDSQQPALMKVEIPKKPCEVVDITRTLDHIKSRPGMYFFCPSVAYLFSYLKGVQRTCECYTAGARIEPDIQQFEAWLCKRFELKNPCRWDRLLLVENGFDERAAFQQFFDSLDEFKKSGGPPNAVSGQKA
jgi:hypothetical protein